MKPGWIMTASGRRIHPLDPRPEDICIEDIAHALSHQCRFSGHVRRFYSVAQHSVLVSFACGLDDALYGLLHDASEAYLVDVPRPLKRSDAFAGYRLAEAHLQAVIYRAFGLSPEEPPSLKVIDRRMLRTEQRDLMPPAADGEDREDVPTFPTVIEPWPPFKARWMFLAQFAALTGRERPTIAYVAGLGAIE